VSVVGTTNPRGRPGGLNPPSPLTGGSDIAAKNE